MSNPWWRDEAHRRRLGEVPRDDIMGGGPATAPSVNWPIVLALAAVAACLVLMVVVALRFSGRLPNG